MRMNKSKFNADNTEMLSVGIKSSLGNELPFVVEEILLPLKGHIHSLKIVP